MTVFGVNGGLKLDWSMCENQINRKTDILCR